MVFGIIGENCSGKSTLAENDQGRIWGRDRNRKRLSSYGEVRNLAIYVGV